jgi:hypothetical protein
VDDKLALGDSVPDPIKTHINGFGAALFDGAVCNAGGTGVVGLDGSRGLGVAEILERGADSSSFFAIMKQGTELGFGSRGDDHFEDNTWNQNITIFRGWGTIGIDGGGEAGVTRA